MHALPIYAERCIDLSDVEKYQAGFLFVQLFY